MGNTPANPCVDFSPSNPPTQSSDWVIGFSKDAFSRGNTVDEVVEPLFRTSSDTHLVSPLLRYSQPTYASTHNESSEVIVHSSRCRGEAQTGYCFSTIQTPTIIHCVTREMTCFKLMHRQHITDHDMSLVNAYLAIMNDIPDCFASSKT